MNDELLIELVRNRQVLYDLKDPKYLNSDLKGRIWQEIGKEMKTDGGNCKARWSNIRDNFRKSLSKRRTTSGQAVKKVKPYRFESQLQFLLEYMEERETKGNIGRHPDTEYAELNNDDEGQESLQTTDIPNSPEVSKQPVSQSLTQHNPTSSNDTPSSSAVEFAKPSRKKNIQPETAASTLMKYLLEKKEEETKSSKSGLPTVTLDNPIDCFLFGISHTLKSLPPYLQNIAKTEIFFTVQKLELQSMQNY
ncbi:transcription factor Adf-1-like [Metopolophium dirhodum]|uniref:transcription factor Adf-1-like n=1 Tax=Metopolophium dirhodum TaxID=44670 RepID=UPI0029901E2D|nr:transcription factor Adf-1-like [Metopolophium dirhodum]